MPHCTPDFAWYLGKFLAGFTGMLFFYLVFLKEREYSCLCRARMRESLRHEGEKRPGRCDCDAGARTRVYSCGCKKRLDIDAQFTGYRKMREWFLENDPAILSECALALERGLPKNDNDLSWLNCIYCEALYNRKTKPTESTASVKKKRYGGRCLFRHCSGLVCVRKVMRRRKHKQPNVHLRVSQDTISDYWRTCDKSVHDKDNVNDEGKHEKNAYIKEKNIKMMHEHRGEIISEHCRNVDDENKREGASRKDDGCTGGMSSPNLFNNKEGLKSRSTFKPLCVCSDKPCSDCNIPPLSLRIAEAETKESTKSDGKPNILKDVCNDKTKHSPKQINKSTVDTVEKKNCLSAINKIDTPNGCLETGSCQKCSKSDTTLTETIITNNCMDSILYHELKKKGAPSDKRKQSKDSAKIDKTFKFKLPPKSKPENVEKVNFHRMSDVDKLVNNFLRDMETFSSRQKQKCNLKQPINKYQLASKSQKTFPSHNAKIVSNAQQKSTSPFTWYESTVNQRMLQKFLCQNCYCDTKTRTYTDSPFNNSKKQSLSQLQSYSSSRPRYRMSTNVQSQRCNYPRGSLKSNRKTDPMADCKLYSSYKTCSPKYESQSLQHKEKPTLVIYKNRKRSRSMYSTNSMYSSSTGFVDTFKKPVHSNSVTCRCSPYKSSRCTMPYSDRYKYNKNGTKTDPTSESSSSLSSSSSRRCRSWTLLSQNCVCHQQKPISSSSCTDIQRWRRKYRGEEKQASSYRSSTSCSCSLSSLSSYGEDYSAGETGRKIKQTWRSEKKSGHHKQARLMYRDKRHVSWNIKNIY